MKTRWWFLSMTQERGPKANWETTSQAGIWECSCPSLLLVLPLSPFAVGSLAVSLIMNHPPTGPPFCIPVCMSLTSACRSEPGMTPGGSGKQCMTILGMETMGKGTFPYPGQSPPLRQVPATLPASSPCSPQLWVPMGTRQH